MSEVYDILQQLSNTTKKLEKEAILKENQDNLVLKECFRLAYSPTIQFFIKKLPERLTKSFEGVETTLDHWVQHSASYLYCRTITGNDARNFLQKTLQHLSVEDTVVVENIISKDLRCGVGVSTINKIWKGLIVKPPRKGATSMSEKALSKITYPAAIELKADGTYCAYNDGFMSRNGNPITGLDTLATELSHIAEKGFALEGELIYDLTKATREKGNGIITKVIKGTASEEECNSVIYQVWDVIATDCYESKGVYNKNALERREILESLVKDCEHVEIIPRDIVDSFEEANTIFENYVKAGFEGAILKQLNTPWKDIAKPTDCVKMKRKEPADLEVVGLYEGEGKAVGMLGGLNLESSDGLIKVNCGSGFSDEQRQVIWADQNAILGKIVEVEYDSITEDKKTKQKSLFLPIFKQIRVDKSEADSYTDIKSKQKL